MIYGTTTATVGNEIDITLLIEGIKQGPDGKPWNAKAAAEEKAKVISYPMPTQAAPQAAPVIIQQPVATPVPAPVPEKKESAEDQLKKKLKGLFN